MKTFNSKSDLVMAYALHNINEGVENDLVSEIHFVDKSVVVAKNAMDAKNYGINGKCVMIKNFGYARI